MTLALDLERRRLVASVGDLAGEPAQRAIGLGGSGLARMWIGQELHRRLQADLAAVEPDYQAEVPVEMELELDGWTVVVTGRADGVAFVDGVPVRVDEIKTLHFAVDLHHLYADERIERFRRQARLYAAMLSTAETPAAARLILVDIVTADERVEEVEWSFESVQAWIRQQLHRLIAAEQRRLDRAARLREAAGRLPFPHPALRPAQGDIVEAVRDALGAERHLLLRAPTGCGKTAAVLHPAVQTALARGRRVFFLTAKTLQQRIAVQTVEAMQAGLFKSLQLRAKSKMCANTEIICHEEFCPYAKEYGVKLVRTQLVPNLLEMADHQDPDRVFDAARQHEVCPFEVSLELLPEVDVVVCDYNYVFDPNIGLGALVGGGSLANAVLVIDEAHNLVDRSREYYSPELGTTLLARAREFLRTRDNQVFGHLAALVDELESAVRETVAAACGDATGVMQPAELPGALLADLRIALDGAILEYFLYKREHDLWMADDPVMDVFLALTRFHRVLNLEGEELVHLAARDADGTQRLKIFCCDASRFLGALLDESAGVVAMSATLQPFEFYRDLLGFDPHRTDEKYVPSPFPPENRLVLAIDDVDTTWRFRREHYDRIADWIRRLARPGNNVLTLFPSYAFLREIHDRLPGTAHRILEQRAGSSDAEQREFLAALSNGDSHLLLAVLGGIFAEGVDYPGSMLSQVIIVSPGLPQFNTEREILKAYYRATHGHSFGYAYLIPGLTRVVQAAGRLIRSAEDRGVITLICRRFLDPRYARLLPEEWVGDDPRNLLFPDPELAVREFFGEE